MGNILTDIVEEVNIKPSKSKLVIKWVISISLSLITLAFVFGQFKSSFFNRLDKIEKSLDNNTESVVNLHQEVQNGFESTNNRIDKIYDDGYKAFDDFQQYNNKQLTLIIDYGSSNKDLLKRMLEVNTLEKNRGVQSNLEQAKGEAVSVIPESKIIVNQIKGNKGYISLFVTVTMGTTDTIYQLRGATNDYINKINRKRYMVGQMTQNETNPILFDVNYSVK
jgi:hypothetical protein